MKKSTALMLCCALVFVSGNDELAKKITTIKPTEAPTITTTVTESTTSSLTTVSTTTSTEIITTSTEVPNTTTPVPASTTVAPTPDVKDPESQKWIVNGTDNNMIIVQLAAQLVIKYNGTDNKNWIVPINIPANKNITSAIGTFSPYDETLILSWNASQFKQNVVSLSFKRDNKTYILSHLTASIAPEELPNFGLNASLKLVHTQEHFNITLGNSYRCVRWQHFNLTKENDKEVLGYAKVSDFRFQAFKTDKKEGFGLAEDCAFDTPDIVPIAVGCALAGLVVIVLVAYLVSRRRSQARGYHSM